MLRHCTAHRRYRTAWRELLHPLPVRARKMEWLKRDAVEENEEILRRPYYTIKSYALPPAVGRQESIHNSNNIRGGMHSSHSLDLIMRQPRRVKTPEQLQALRDRLRFIGVTGPMPQATSVSTKSYADTYGSRLRPRYPESWDTVPPHQPSRELL
ncbi:hypothetical protein, conserved [Trypanosoma brucei brucei TREU927]|uniref:Uncharacterized protein n=1 Tax=Trypanosoma brucei brucei (strain 927/4 GUTat10.1) TaxID=185431 RepID=Q57XS1_TRYB2|nr:hypothetical protein, conserved [Trypanosoma brucei brucei TREU927]AAX69610.1 hypothetical protein, conserved [Trypanosoma brucei]AAZ12762.1 hypothetical protein, conserved [Trypanosoma brucei brucei TREU927]